MFFSFDPNSSVPLFRQLRNQVICAIAHGELHPGDHLPTIRKLQIHSLAGLTIYAIVNNIIDIAECANKKR